MKLTLRRLISFLLILGGACCLYVWYDNRAYTEKQIDLMFEPITSRYGIKIVYQVKDDFLSPVTNPGTPAGPSARSKVKPIKHRVLARYPVLLQKAFEKYPAEVIKGYLNAIYFAGTIDDNGVRYGGSNDPYRRIIYIVDNGWQNADSSINVIHHEFSSLLLSRHSFLLNSWLKANPEGFEYLYKKHSSEKRKIYDSTSLTGTEEDFKNGFMNSYGQTNFENDFNEYAAMIFTYPEKFKKIMHQYPRVRAKFLLWLDFYHRIDPVFTEAYLLGGG